MPSVNSSSRPNVWPSSTFTTPSLPTFSIASAIASPISRSREEMLATRATSSRPDTFFDCVFRFSTTVSTAVSMPRFRPIGFAPAATFFRPSRTIACASTVAVVGDRRRAVPLVEDDVAALRAERHLDRVGEDVHAPLQRAPRVLVELQLLVRHSSSFPVVLLGGRAGELALPFAFPRPRRDFR